MEDFLGLAFTSTSASDNGGRQSSHLAAPKEFKVTWKTRKDSHMCLAEHMMMIRDRYVRRILDTRFEVTRNKLNFALFDTNMELDSYDMGMVAPFSFDEDVHDKIGTNECNTIGRIKGDIIKTGILLRAYIWDDLEPKSAR